MKRRILIPGILIALVVYFLAVNVIPAQEKGTAPEKNNTEQEIVKAAKDILAKNKDAIIMVRLVLKTEMSYGGRSMGKHEQKIEANGTIVDPSGLTIISHSQTNPGGMFENMDMGMGGDEGLEGKLKTESELASVKIVLNDGKELPASIVLQDKDLDVAFVRPDEKGLKLPYVKLEKTTPPEVLEQIVTISRLDFSTGREPVVAYFPIMSVIKKPRTHYLAMGTGETGCPAFNSNEQCLGIMLKRESHAKLSNLSSISIMSFMPAVLPAEDIIEVMKQVPLPAEKKEDKK